MLEFWLGPLLTVVVLVMTFVCYFYFAIWLQALVSGAHVSMANLIAMSLRRVNPRTIVLCRVMITQAGLSPISTAMIEAQLLAGGDPTRVARALIAADRAGIPLDWDTAAVVDLAGRDILDAVQISVSPIVINCPDPNAPGSDSLTGVAKDGIELKVRVRVTVRMDLLRLVGGATEATVVARIGQGVISAIGASATYHAVMAEPMLICRKVTDMKLDSETAFAIVSIDIAEMQVGRNVGARLKIETAEAAIRIAQAEAEKRRAMAVAREQEMRALTVENKATLLAAEALIPIGIAYAFKSGAIAVPPRESKVFTPTEPNRFAWRPAVSRNKGWQVNRSV